MNVGRGASRPALRTRRRRPGVLGTASVIAFVILTPGVAATLIGASVGPRQKPRYYFGTLQTNPSKARLEHRRGIQVANLGLRWDRYEPSQHVFSRRYVRWIRRELRRLQRAGALVELGLGINHPPAWLFRHYPQAAYVNQYGRRYTGTANIVFSEAARREVQTYVSRVQRDIGLQNFWAIRVGVNADGEFIYPAADADGIQDNSYWAFDENAQASPSDPGRPPTVPPNPFPGWRPGYRTYHGRLFTVREVSQWYDWYLAALSDAINWQCHYYRAVGYRGYLMVLIPGAGLFPNAYRAAVAHYLDGAIAPRLMGIGAGFFKTIALITDRANVQIVSTSLVDNSGRPRNNGCAAADGSVDILADRPDPAMYNWSSVRWIADIARRDGFTLLNGESAGPQVAPYYPGVMDDAARQMASCGLKGLMWAFDSSLYDATPGSSLRDYATVIRRYDR
jgi:hypothetical protein